MVQSSYSVSVMRIQARQGSAAEQLYVQQGALAQAWPMPTAIAPGIDPAPMADLIYHGGKTVEKMQFQNVYLGGAASWHEGDMTLIDSAIKRAMQNKGLDNVMVQYFPGGRISCDVRHSIVVNMPKPVSLGEPDIHALAIKLYDDNLIDKSDLDSCIFNLLLPSGTILTLDSASSQNGLGGYHGSVHFIRNGQSITLYYSANVYSEFLPGGVENGIVVFDKPWKNVVATLYHEDCEFRTDPDVSDAIANRSNDFLGWTSRTGREVGDQPIEAAGDLRQIFQEVADTGRTRIPVQFMYSNVVHGAEGPLARPHGAARPGRPSPAMVRAGAQHNAGVFSGNPKTEWLTDANGMDRDMVLLEDFWYRDPAGRQWDAPKGSVINGTSIPQALWTVVGSPYTGDYRRASVVHDVACDTAGVNRDDADTMFYQACRSGGCGFLQAQILYTGVRLGTWASATLSAQTTLRLRSEEPPSVAAQSNQQFLRTKFDQIAQELQTLNDDAPLSEIDAIIANHLQF